MTTFDSIRPPEKDLIEDCVHCGFCLPTCPTYKVFGEEMDSPRGRIVLMREAADGASLSPQMVTHWDRCLGCMACVTACPSGVQYDKLIEDTRAQVERNHTRGPVDRLWRSMLFELFPHPGRLRALAPLIALSRKLGMQRIASGNGGPLPRVRALASLSPSTPLRKSFKRLPEHTAARGERRARVGLLQGCVQRVFFHDVNVATANVLAAEGFEVHAPRLPRCCGALQMHTGYDSRDLARATIEAFEDCDFVVANAAGCGSSMKDYPHLLRDDDRWRERAQAFSDKVRDVTELLAEAGEPRAARNPLPLKVAYHDACHLAHAQAVRAQPRELLRQIPELELVEPQEWEICCGSAGIYNLLNPEPATELGQRKVQNLLATGAELIAAGNPGCAIQIAAVSERMGRPLRVIHPIELIQMSIQGGAANGKR
ncbi:MAG TPA: heterodisulfide reductase-related iron-sulfur binding cluster [Thermoleophilaceae bacterium]|nr:heterodisulfide reductase-related iron-sulfur binding cluster [Thermoleophilaceae bacterium]